MENNWPVVTSDDHGIRPAGRPDECFYCNQKVGAEHLRDCVVIHKKIRARYTFEIELTVPHRWTKENFESHHNESSWCANNAVHDLGAYCQDDGGPCLCGKFKAELLEVIDESPARAKD